MTTYTLGNSPNPLPLLSAFSLSNMTLNVTSVMVVVGSMTALDTLLPVKFKSDPGAMPQLCSTTLLHTTLLLVPLLFTWFAPKPCSVTSILALLSVPDDIILLILPFLRRYALAVPPLVLHQVLNKFLLAQSQTKPQIVAALTSTTLHYALLQFLDPGSLLPSSCVKTVAFIFVASTWCNFLALAAYCYVFRPFAPSTFTFPPPPPSLLSSQARQQFGLSIFGILALSEWLYWEYQTFLLSSTHSETAMASQAVVYALIPLLYMVPLGWAIGTCVLVGNALGEGKIERARKVMNVAFLSGFANAALIGCAIRVAKAGIIDAFTGDEEVKSALDRIWSGVALFVFTDQVFGVQGGLLRSLGLQGRLSLLIVLSLYLVGVPLSYWSVSDAGLNGLWRVMAIPYLVLNLGMVGAWKNANLSEVGERLKGGGGGEYEKVVMEEDDGDGEEVEMSGRINI